MTGIQQIAAERRRQQRKEHWTAEHDDQHRSGQLAVAAACYAVNKGVMPVAVLTIGERDAWPWDKVWDKRRKHDRIRSLQIAGALIAAELDRLKRAAKGEGP